MMILKKRAGFTLIETIIYIALFAIIIGGGLVGAYQVFEGSGHLNNKNIAEQEASFVIRKIDWAWNSISSINGSGSKLSIGRVSSPTLIIFDSSAGAVRISYDDILFVPLTTANVTVSGLTFTHIAAVGGAPEGIQADFVINGETFTTKKYMHL